MFDYMIDVSIANDNFLLYINKSKVTITPFHSLAYVLFIKVLNFSSHIR
jgi:hypothetical protein